ncbi:arsenical-resistance protein ACR3 [Pholiota conissans]|uniref:Arsenical-resistance protein ACR3 n=1 Tax=Pholiota conissans TaxID=109636 RepID=A0A9P6CZ44_9AGAR|nr:arsenical-resistance protein ACR3 [Pholiota conissans]
MILGVILGEFAPGVRERLETAKFQGVSIPVVVGLIVMMWPVLTKVQYEKLPAVFRTARLWKHLFLSVMLNWIAGPFLMLGLAWATLPDLPGYRTGVIMVGIARCIAMVAIWNDLAGGDAEYCAILVVVNALLQIALFSPFSVLFINIISGANQGGQRVNYGDVTISVLIYLGIPIAAGIATRYGVIALTSRRFFEKKFLPVFSPFSLLGLLYTIIVLFAYQGHSILHDIGPVFRIFVPQILYFLIMWTSTFFFVYWLSKMENRRIAAGARKVFGYDTAVVQAFTAASNNFELAIAIAIATYGVDSEQALAATIGPLTEVPVLLSLTWVALYFRHILAWEPSVDAHADVERISDSSTEEKSVE